MNGLRRFNVQPEQVKVIDTQSRHRAKEFSFHRKIILGVENDRFINFVNIPKGILFGHQQQ